MHIVIPKAATQERAPKKSQKIKIKRDTLEIIYLIKNKVRKENQMNKDLRHGKQTAEWELYQPNQ